MLFLRHPCLLALVPVPECPPSLTLLAVSLLLISQEPRSLVPTPREPSPRLLAPCGQGLRLSNPPVPAVPSLGGNCRQWTESDRSLSPQFISSTDPFQKALREEEKRRKKEEKRKEIRKGPRISRSQSEL